MFSDVCSTFAHRGKHEKTSAGNNVSAMMFPSFPGA